MARREKLGAEHRVTLPQGEVRYFERGTVRPIVFLHGILTNANLWRSVVPALADAGFRCLAPDLPLGGHETPMRADADLSPTGNADLIADFLAALDLRDVLLVGNDTGGALTQIMLARRPDHVDRVVLLPSDCLEYFFPPIFRPLLWGEEEKLFPGRLAHRLAALLPDARVVEVVRHVVEFAGAMAD